jgi:hypothetical protein
MLEIMQPSGECRCVCARALALVGHTGPCCHRCATCGRQSPFPALVRQRALCPRTWPVAAGRVIGRTLLLGLMLTAASRATAQTAAVAPDSAPAQIRLVLRAFYLNLASQNWDALAAYVLSPKLLERRGAPGELQRVVRDRTRSRGAPAATAAPPACPSSASPMIDGAVIRVDGDWADVSVPRCSGPSPGVDQFGMLYFEERWRFIYTDLFQAPPAPETAVR